MLVLSGKRGGFGAMKPMLRLMRDDPGIELQLVVTDQHLSYEFGFTVNEIAHDFDISAVVSMNQKDDSPLERARALGVCLGGLSSEMARLRPDIAVLYGDRGEVLSAAIAATCLGIPIAHVQGGDVSGSLDEQVRHAVTKLAHLHFASTEESAQRLRRLGEEAWRVHAVGDSHIDLIVAGEYASADQVARELDIDLNAPIVVVLQHSETTAPHESYDQMAQTLLAVRELELQTVVVYPCSDIGYGGILRAIKDLATGPNFRVVKNLDAPLFWGLLARAAVLAGNSSAGLIETPSFGLPAINVGRRQEGRLHATNVLHAAHDQHEIRQMLQRALSDESFRTKARDCTQPYGDGHAGERILEVLTNIPLDDRLMVKRMTY